MSQSELHNFEELLRGLREHKQWFFSKIIKPDLVDFGLFSTPWILDPKTKDQKFIIRNNKENFEIYIFYNFGFFIPSTIQAEIFVSSKMSYRTAVYQNLKDVNQDLIREINNTVWQQQSQN